MLEYELRQKLRGLYEEIRTMGIKPDFSAVARQYDIARHTAAKYWKEEKVKDRILEKASPLDQYFDEIREKAESTVCSKKAPYKYLKNKNGEDTFICYSTFAHYMQRKELHEENKLPA